MQLPYLAFNGQCETAFKFYEECLGGKITALFPQEGAPAEAERIFQALGENGKVHMPIQKTFFAARFGMPVDVYRIPWMVICEQDA